MVFKFLLQLVDVIFNPSDFNFEENVTQRHLVLKLVRLEVWGVDAVNAICTMFVCVKIEASLWFFLNADCLFTFGFLPTVIVYPLNAFNTLVFRCRVYLGRLLEVALAVIL
jgi:hypothetical protein